MYKTCKFFSVLVTADNKLSKANRFFHKQYQQSQISPSNETMFSFQDK